MTHEMISAETCSNSLFWPFVIGAIIGFLIGLLVVEPNSEERLLLRKHGFRLSNKELRDRLKKESA